MRILKLFRNRCFLQRKLSRSQKSIQWTSVREKLPESSGWRQQSFPLLSGWCWVGVISQWDLSSFGWAPVGPMNWCSLQWRWLKQLSQMVLVVSWAIVINSGLVCAVCFTFSLLTLFFLDYYFKSFNKFCGDFFSSNLLSFIWHHLWREMVEFLWAVQFALICFLILMVKSVMDCGWWVWGVSDELAFTFLKKVIACL